MKTAGLKKVSSFWLAASFAIFGLVAAIGFMSAPAAAQGTPEQQQACTPDVMRLCNAFIPDVAKITACMRKMLVILNAMIRSNQPWKAPQNA